MRSIVIATLLISLAGCADTTPVETQGMPEADGPEPETVERTVRISGSPACPDESGRYQAIISHSGTYTVFDSGALSAHVYEESNGMTGLQTDKGCPQAPDTRIA